MNYDPKPTKCNLCGGKVIYNKADVGLSIIV